MTPRVRIFEKKRGSRYTGNSTAGSLGVALFFAAFLLGGFGLLAVLFFSLSLPEWRVYNDYIATRCVVRDKRLGESDSEGTPTYRPELLIEYTAGGNRHETWTYDATGLYTSLRGQSQAILDRFEIGGEYPCWYNPHDIGQAVLVRHFTWFAWLTLIVPATLIVIGGGGLVFAILNWGKSAERRAVESQRGSPLDMMEDERKRGPVFPTLPDDAIFTNSPGTTLRYRLPTAPVDGVSTFMLGVFCLIWNGMVSIFVVLAVRSHIRGEPEWLLSIFTLPFVGVGAMLLYFFLRRALVSTGVGPTILEISDYPLYPGEEYELFLSQSGSLRLSELTVAVVCEETTTYRQGTDTRTRTLRVYDERVFQRDEFEVSSGLPFEARFPLRVFEGAMHSLESTNNRVSWKLIVRGSVAGWPDFERAYALNIYPATQYASGA